MAYIVPTLQDFRDRFPKWSTGDCPEGPIKAMIARAQRQVDESWTEGDYAEAILLYTAHLLTLEGFGPEANRDEGGSAVFGFGVKKIEAGDTKITFGNSATLADAAASGSDLMLTTYGVSFARMRRQNRGGPRVVTGARGPYSPAATDWPPSTEFPG